MAKESETSLELYQFARGYAWGRGFRFGDGADQNIRTGIEAQVRARWPEFLADSGGTQAKAELGLARFVSTMIDAREDVYDATRLGSNIIGEDTFYAATSKLCPLFPIC